MSIRTAVISVVLAFALVMSVGGAAQAAAGPWKVQSSPNVGSLANALGGVSALSRTDAWAVGTTQQEGGTDFHTLAEHWDGSSWSVVPSPDGGILDRLNSVVQLASDDAWAVGEDYNLDVQAYQTLVEHWDGSSWTIVPSPSRGTRYDSLQSVVAVGPSDLWAVGVSQTSGSTIRNLTLTEHWDGASWTIVPSPNRPQETSAWLLGVTAVSSTDVWAVGFDHTGALAEHWNGASWSIVNTPNPGGALGDLTSVDALGASDIWAVGNSRVPGQQSRTLTEHWNGASWTIVSSPSNGTLNNFLAGVTALSLTDVWAVGTYAKDLGLGFANRTITEHWDGTSWTIVPSPNPGTDSDVLLGSAAVGASAVFAVGGFEATGAQRTLVLVNTHA
jgi:hypothetical protein